MTNTTPTTPDQTFKGHPSWAHWNVLHWINGIGGLYSVAYDLAVEHGEDKAADVLAAVLEGQRTPDGAPFTPELIRYAIRNIAD